MNQKENKIFIAVDPSLTCTGIAVMKGRELLDTYLIKTNSKLDNRFEFIGASAFEIFEQNPTDTLVVEQQYLAIRSNSIVKVIEARGIIEGAFIASCVARGTEPKLFAVTPSEARKAIGIKRAADRKLGKAMIKNRVMALYPQLGDKQKQDVYDAVSVGVAGYPKLP